MRKITYVCDRCGADIENGALTLQFNQVDEHGMEEPADQFEISKLFEDPLERNTAAEALMPGWDLCPACVMAILRTLIRRDPPRALVKTENLADTTTTKRRGRPKKDESESKAD